MGQLDGVRVVDLSTYIAAPSCARILASYGADVIKVESPKGDDLRAAQVSYFYPAETSEYSFGMDVQNAGKKGLALNLKDPAGMEAMMKLLETADVFVTNNRVKALVKMGLDYDTLHKKFPRLIHASILGYGELGPLKDKPGFDYTAYFSRGGIANSLMEKGTSPAIPASGFGDNYAGIALSSGICAALYRQAKTGEGSLALLNSVQRCLHQERKQTVLYVQHIRQKMTDGFSLLLFSMTTGSLNLLQKVLMLLSFLKTKDLQHTLLCLTTSQLLLKKSSRYSLQRHLLSGMKSLQDLTFLSKSFSL